MPILVYSIDDGLYLNEWLGAVNHDEMMRAHDELVAFNQERNNRPFVLVNDVRQAQVSGTEIRGFQQIARTHYNPPLAVMVVGAPLALRLVSAAATKILGIHLNVQFLKTLDDAYVYARKLLKETLR